MQQAKKNILIGVGAVAIAAISAFAGYQLSDGTTHRASNLQAVKTVLVEQKTIPLTVHANGYVSAINSVDVRPRVQNIVREVHVKEGQFVKAGQLLFTLDDRNDQANLEKARIAVETGRTELADAELTLKHNGELLEKNFVSQAVLDASHSKVESLRKTLQANQAAAQAGSVALGYNRITASIPGRIGVINVHSGSMAQASGKPMVTITQIAPIAVSFSLPGRELSNISAVYPQSDVPVQVQLPGQPIVTGKLSFIDNAVDAKTGTIRMRAEFDNAPQRLWPGTDVKLSLVSRNVENATTVPAQAIVSGSTDKFMYVVQSDNTVAQQKIDVVAIEGDEAVVTGLTAGARVVVEGAQNLQPGSAVTEAKDASAAVKKSASGTD